MIFLSSFDQNCRPSSDNSLFGRLTRGAARKRTKLRGWNKIEPRGARKRCSSLFLFRQQLAAAATLYTTVSADTLKYYSRTAVVRRTAHFRYQ